MKFHIDTAIYTFTDTNFFVDKLKSVNFYVNTLNVDVVVNT